MIVVVDIILDPKSPRLLTETEDLDVITLETYVFSILNSRNDSSDLISIFHLYLQDYLDIVLADMFIDIVMSILADDIYYTDSNLFMFADVLIVHSELYLLGRSDDKQRLLQKPRLQHTKRI